jgi:hypothetical protein
VDEDNTMVWKWTGRKKRVARMVPKHHVSSIELPKMINGMRQQLEQEQWAVEKWEIDSTFMSSRYG